MLTVFKSSHRPFPVLAALSQQRGLALLAALLMLLIMSIASVALVRSVDTTALLAGNIAFRQGASMAGDVGVEMARDYLLSHLGDLEHNNPETGYYATRQDALDLTGNRTPGNPEDDVTWLKGSAGIATPACPGNADAAGNTLCYIIHRMCDLEGPTAIDSCSSQLVVSEVTNPPGYVPPGSSRGSEASRTSYGGQRDGTSGDSSAASALLTYYRITVRIEGPRNNVSYVQAFLLL